MAITGSRSRLAVYTPSLTVATTVATALAACAGQVGLAIPAVLNGLFQQEPGHDVVPADLDLRRVPGPRSHCWS
jgi:hypothetical protein